MVEESKSDAQEAGTAVADAPEAEGSTEDQMVTGPTPISIPKDQLTAEAKKEAEEELGEPIPDIAYEVKGTDNLPHSILSVKIEVGAEIFQEKIDEYYENLRGEVALPGYRKGKAPIKLIRIRMGEESDRDTMSQTALNVMRQEVPKRELTLLADAQITNWKIEAGQPLEFEVRLEVEPEIELKEYKGLTATVETSPVDDAMVDQELERVRSGQARQESASKDTKVAADHAILVDLKVTGQDGRELKHLSREDWLVSNIAQNFPSELAEKVEGKKAGDTVSVEVANTRRNRRGDEIQFTDNYEITVKDIKVTKFPDLDDEFAKDLGEYETLAELRKAIFEKLEEGESQRIRNASVGKIMEVLVEKNEVDAPGSMVAAVQQQAMMQDSYQLSQMGLRLQDVVHDPQQYFASQQHSAESMVKQSLLRQKLVELEGLEVTDAEVDAEIEKMAEAAGRKALAVRAKLEADKQLDQLKGDLLQGKVTDFLLAENTVEQVEAAPETEEEGEGEAEGKGDDKPKAKKKAPKKKAAAEKASPTKAKAKTEDKPKKKAAAKKKAAPKKKSK